MIRHNKKKPLIALHVPKTAGTSFSQVLEEWFGKNLYLHYYNVAENVAPKKVKLKKHFFHKVREEICIYGHFNKIRGVGVHTYYPEVKQFITILRDPFERAVSLYFFQKRRHIEFGKKIDLDKFRDLGHYLKITEANYLNHFPFELTNDNFEHLLHKHFIHIGITEDLNASVKIIADKLGFRQPETIKTLNATERTEEVPYHLKQEFIEKHQLEYAVYAFAKINYDKY